MRIANTALKGKKCVQLSLTGMPGIGRRMAMIISKKAGVDPRATMGYLADNEIERIKEELDRISETVPKWMLNRKRDPVTGKDVHVSGADIAVSLREDLNMMRKIRCYKGIRHERGLRVRGQRTKSTGRRGAVVGVSRKKR